MFPERKAMAAMRKGGPNKNYSARESLLEEGSHKQIFKVWTGVEKI